MGDHDGSWFKISPPEAPQQNSPASEVRIWFGPFRMIQGLGPEAGKTTPADAHQQRLLHLNSPQVILHRLLSGVTSVFPVRGAICKPASRESSLGIQWREMNAIIISFSGYDISQPVTGNTLSLLRQALATTGGIIRRTRIVDNVESPRDTEAGTDDCFLSGTLLPIITCIRSRRWRFSPPDQGRFHGNSSLAV
jgi:hypothetical protein